MRTTPITRTSATRPLLALLALLLAAVAVLTSAPASDASDLDVRGCSAYRGATTLGTTYTDDHVKIYACGNRPSFDGRRTGGGPVVRPFTGSTTYYLGYQCIELVARYLQARYGAEAGKANGAQAVDRYVAAYPDLFVKISNGTPRQAPRKGDVLSLSARSTFSDVGHTGIVTASSISSWGNGTIKALEQNWGGTGGTRGYHVYTVRSWRVQYAGLPYVSWLRAR